MPEGNENSGQVSQNSGQASQNPPATSGQPTGQDPAGSELSVEQLKTQLAELRKENASHRVGNKTLSQELEELRKFKTESEEKQLSETEKLQKQAKEASEAKSALENELRYERATNVIALVATKFGLPAELAVRLVSPEFDREGNLVNVEEAIKALITQYPNLIQNGNLGSTGNPPRGGADNSQLAGTNRRLGLSRAFYYLKK